MKDLVMSEHLHLGAYVIKDVANPQPHEIDLQAIVERLSIIRRFNGNPDALTVMQHCRLCRSIAVQLNYPWPVIQWAFRHDWHEAATGDIPAPIKRAINSQALHDLERAWDYAIALACNITPPDDEIRNQVSFIDRVALILEKQALGMEANASMVNGIDAVQAWRYAIGMEYAA